MEKRTDNKRGIVATIAFVIFINFFLYHTIGMFAVTLILFALHSLILKLSLRTPAVRIVFCIGIVSAVAVSMRGSEFVSLLAAAFSCLSLVILMYLSASGGRFFRSFSEIVFAPLSLLAPYVNGFVLGAKTLVGKGGKVKSLIVGLAVGVPLTFVLLQHLIRADTIFAYTVRAFFDQTLLQRVMTHGIFSLILFFVLLPVGVMVVRNRINARALLAQFSFAREAAVVVGLVALVVGLFLIVQFPYIFVRVAAETDLSRYGVATYSEYVKQGFGEFLFIACILYAVAWFGLLGRSVRWVQGILIIEIGVYIISLFRRVWLYGAFHGLTLGRLYGGLFLVWVSLMFATLIARHVRPKIRWVQVECIGTVALFFLFAFGNAEYFVAAYKPPTVNGRVDNIYLSRLSADGVEGWERSYAFARSALTDPSYAQKKILDTQDREAIDYAGIIVTQVTRRMDQYIRVYGTLPEQQQYVASVLSFHKNMVQVALEEISRRATEERRGKVASGQYGLMEKDLTEELTWVTNATNVSQADPSGYLGRIAVWTNPLVSFYTIFTNADYKTHRFDMLDRLYLWNNADQRAYDRIKISIPLQELFSLQRSYIRLVERIAKQPSGDQGYTRDVSFDGPFLAPL